MTNNIKKLWTLPKHFERYRKLLEDDLGGNSLEELINDHKTNGFNNIVKTGLICMADSKVKFLYKLEKEKFLC